MRTRGVLESQPVFLTGSSDVIRPGDGAVFGSAPVSDTNMDKVPRSLSSTPSGHVHCSLVQYDGLGARSSPLHWHSHLKSTHILSFL